MKKYLRLTEGKAVLLFAIGLLLIVVWIVQLGHPFPTAESLSAYVHKHEAFLTRTAEDALSDKTEAPSSLLARWILYRGNIDHIWPQDDRVIFSTDASNAPIEGHLQLVYLPDGRYTFPFDEPEWHSVETDDENVLRWEGGYMGGRGWVNVTRLSEYFFLEEAYLPT